MAAQNSDNKVYKFISYNVMSNNQLSGLLSIIDLEKPDILFLQELMMDTEHLSTFIASKHGYKAVSNMDETDPNKPGTGLVWHESVPVTQVSALEPCRLQTAFIGPYPIVNVYPPAGSDNGPGRRLYFRETLFRMMRGLGRVPIMGGDWNCVINVKDIEGGDYSKKKSQELANLVRDFNLSDAFRHLYPDKREYTWARRGMFGSRLDRFYLPMDMVGGLQEVTHHSYLSDHKYNRMLIKLPSISRTIKVSKNHDSGYWKLNVSILKYDDFMLEFRVMWARLMLTQGDYRDVATWWDELAKPECRLLCMRMSAMLARCKRGLKEMLMVMLESALDEKNWVEVAVVRGKLRDIMRDECMGFQVRSRFKENLETEKASLYHVNREKKKAGQKNISKLMVGGMEVEDRDQVEGNVCGYFESLFHGHHRSGGVNVGKAFQPDFKHVNEFLEGLGQLSEESKAKIQADIKLDELEEAIKGLEDNKAPGLDGLSAEFYKKTGDMINPELLKVLSCQLDRLDLIESDKGGATRLCPKVDGVPRVDQLRPITLLNLDYKILTKIITNRLLRIMGEIILSSQSCSVPGKNILFGASNILSVVQYIEKYGGKAAIVSYDLFKAYDRVYLPFLYKVMQKMNFGEKFIDWIRMFHQGATTSFILNFLTKRIDILISVRQGDPLAMILFLIFMEPLLLMIRKSIRGTFFIGERIHETVNVHGDHREQCVNSKDNAYVDDVSVSIQDEADLLVIDEIFGKFEEMSGAILNRDSKTKIMGVGEWKDKQTWVLPWVKVEPSLKIFGIRFFPNYEQILEINWTEAKKGFVDCLHAWKLRSLETIFQKTEVLKTFALPKLWYKALLLPLPGKLAGQFEEAMRQFIWRGKLEKPAFSEMCNPVEEGGLGVTCIRSKCDSLLLKQLLRMLEDKEAVHHQHIAFWLGNFIRNYEPLSNFPHALRVGEEVDRPLEKETALTMHFTRLLQEYKYGEKNEYFDIFETGNIKFLRAKLLYQFNTTTFTPPAIIFKRDVPDWGLVWDRIGSLMLEPRGREVMYMVINNLYPTQQRLYRINLGKKTEKRRVWSNLCQHCNQGVVEDCLHLFMECDRVKEGWLWVRVRVMNLLNNMQGLSNYELLHLCFTKELVENEVMWLMGQWVQLVYEEVVVKNRTLGDQFTRGQFRYKYLESLTMRMPQLNHISDVTVIEPG